MGLAKRIGLKPTLLWADDNPSIIKGKKRIIEKDGFKVFPVTEKEEVVDVFKKENPSIVLLDINWSGFSSKDTTGFELEKEIRKIQPMVGIGAYSAYTEEECYTDNFQHSNFDAVIQKARTDDEKKELKRVVNYLAILSDLRFGGSGGKLLDPNTINIDTFSQLPVKIKREVSKCIYKKNIDIISSCLKNNNWLLICGGRIVKSGIDALSNRDKKKLNGDERREMEKKLRFPTFYFTQTPIIESTSVWAKNRNNDYYPTLKLLIKKQSMSDSQNHSFEINGHFDTGCNKTHISDRFFTSDLSYDQCYGSFQGSEYTYWERFVDVMLFDSNSGERQSKELEFCVVDEWDTSGFVQIFNREILIGRDILNKFKDANFTLSPYSRSTNIQFL